MEAEDNIKIELKELGWKCAGQIHQAQGTDQRWAPTEVGNEPRSHIKGWVFD